MSRNGRPDDRHALDMPVWMIVLVVAVMLLIAVFAFWHSAKVSYESLPRHRSAVAQ